MKALSRTIRTLAAVVALLLSAAPAYAQQVCLLHGTAVAQLASQHSEQAIGRGLIGDGKAVVEIFVSEAGTWTAVVTDTQGRSCVVASGVSWTQLPQVVGDPT